MAWNQPGDDNRRPAARGARGARGTSGARGTPDSASLDETLRRWQERVRRLWRPGGGRGRAVLALVGLAALVWLASGYYQIEPAERGVVQSFGRYVATELPGSGWHWPWPIQTLTKRDVERLDSLEARSTVLSSDQGLINLGWSVQYRVADLRQFLFQLHDPVGTARQASETVIRELAAGDTLQSLLSGQAREQLGAQAQGRIQQILDRYAAGMRVSSVSLTDVSLPDPVTAAQRDATHAADDRRRALTDAHTYASSLVLKAQAAAQQQLSDARVYATQTLAQAQADAEHFTQMARAYELSPRVMRDRLYIQTIEGILASSHKIFVDAREGTTINLPLDKLTEQLRSGAPHASSPAVSAVASAPPIPDERRIGDERSRDRGQR
jgi:modulator of FtsH protease HflK